MIYGHNETNIGHYAGITFADTEEATLAVLLGWCLLNGIRPLRAKEAAEARAHNRIVYTYPITDPYGVGYAMAFDLTDSQVGAPEALRAELERWGL